MTIGVTGGIGSGKSTVCGLFERWGARRFDADEVGDSALQDPNVQRKLLDAFGEGILSGDGTLDRKALARLAFASDLSRAKLTDVVWPEVGRRLRDIVAKMGSTDSGLLVIEASVLLEKGDPEGIYESIVVVTAREDIRIKRAMERLGISESDVRSRMEHQMPEDEKVKFADYVMVNDGSLETLECQARSVWGSLKKGTKE